MTEAAPARVAWYRRIPGAVWGLVALAAGMGLGTAFPVVFSPVGDGVAWGFGWLAKAAPFIIFFTISAAIVDMLKGGKAAKFAGWVGIAFTLAGLFAAFLAILLAVPMFQLEWSGGSAAGSLFGGHSLEEVVLAHLTPSLIAVLYGIAAMVVLHFLSRWAWARWFAQPTMRVVRTVGVEGIALVGRGIKAAFPFVLFGIGVYIPTGIAKAVTQSSAGLASATQIDTVFGTNPVALYFLTVVMQVMALAVFMAIVVVGVCWYTGFSIKRFFRDYFAYVYPFAWATSSSAASIPVNLERTGEGLGVRKEVRDFVIPLGATVNLDGAIMACFIITAMASILTGYTPTFLDLLLLVIPIKLVTMGVPGIPGGIAAVVPPLVAEILPIPEENKAAFLAIWFGFSVGLSDQFRTGVNTTTNGVVALLFEKWYPKHFSKGEAAADASETPAEDAPSGA